LDIPDEFIDFVGALDRKLCHFYDSEGRYYTMRLRDVLSSGVRRLQGFKKEIGLGQKVIKLKNGSRREMKNEMYNWAYFYICFSLSLSFITLHLHPLHPVLLYLPQTLHVLLHITTPHLTPQLPWNNLRTGGLIRRCLCFGVEVGAVL
jgi:hypothetical protein